MSDYAIGISGLYAAQKALDVVGNNIANAATEGYHRQRIELSSSAPTRQGSLLLGTGVTVDSISRLVDNLLEKELLRQNSLLGQVDRELVMLQTVESALGELTGEENGLNATIDGFFNAMDDLTAHPTDVIWQNQVVSKAEAMAGQFRLLGEFLSSSETRIKLEAEDIVTTINVLSVQIAELNKNVQKAEVGGGYANDLRDQRDKLISDLSELIGVDTQTRPFGVVDVNVAGIPVVMGASNMQLEVGLDENAKLGISIKGVAIYRTGITGGKIGGLLSLRNNLISDVHTDLNSLAKAIIQQINQHHVQGVGSAGSFTTLTGAVMAGENLSDFDPSVSDGTFYIRLTNTSTGAVTRNAIAVDASADTLSTIATSISAITGLTGSVVASRLRITADANYEFDFLPSVLSTPTASTLTGSPPTVSVSGIYSGTANDTFTFTVSGTGSVGNGTLQLVVTDGGANTVATVNVGLGYAAGDKVDIGNGIKIALTTGSLNDSETFEVDAFANADTSGMLSVAGMNAFFTGSGAGNIAVSSDVSATPGRVAAARGADMTDNSNALLMAAVKDQAQSTLNSLTVGEFYRRVVTDVGQKVSIKQMQRDNFEQVLKDLEDRQLDISGVNINEEAAQLLMYEQMFQAMARYIKTIQTSLASLMNIL